MPAPLLELQRRLSIIGAIRAGAEKPARGPGQRLECFRLTSPRQHLIEQAAVLYGGEVSTWRSPVGDEWQVYTKQTELPVLVMPNYSLRQSYELWQGPTKRLRLCDGIEEELSGRPCICNTEGDDQCDIYTRLIVALPELDTVLGWKLITTGTSAAHELPTMMALVASLAAGQAFVPARLRLDQRRGAKDGQVVRFVVPTIDLGVGYLQLATGPPAENARALPPSGGFTPAAPRTPTVREALGAVAQPTPQTSSRTAPLGPTHPPPRKRQALPVDDNPPAPAAGGAEGPTGQTAGADRAANRQPGQEVGLAAAGAPLPPQEQAVLDQIQQEFNATPTTPQAETTTKTGDYPEPPISDAQRRKLHATFRDKGVIERPAKIEYCSGVLGRHIESSAELTTSEASRILDHLAQYDSDNPQTYPLPEDF